MSEFIPTSQSILNGGPLSPEAFSHVTAAFDLCASRVSRMEEDEHGLYSVWEKHPALVAAAERLGVDVEDLHREVRRVLSQMTLDVAQTFEGEQVVPIRRSKSA